MKRDPPRDRQSGAERPGGRPRTVRNRRSIGRARPAPAAARRLSRPAPAQPRRVRQLPEAVEDRRPTPIGSTPSARWPATCSTGSTTSSAPPTRSGPRPRRGSPRGSTWSTSSCSRPWPSTASSRSPPSGKPFDPNQHEAVVQQPDAEHPEGTVVAELSKGYKIHDRVLRPSKVAVSVKPDRRPTRGARLVTDRARTRHLRCVNSGTRSSMPTYDYICDACEHEFEAFESIKADPQTICPECTRGQAPPQDRRGGRHPLQGVGLLPDRLSERFLQEAGRGRQARRRQAGHRLVLHGIAGAGGLQARRRPRARRSGNGTAS